MALNVDFSRISKYLVKMCTSERARLGVSYGRTRLHESVVVYDKSMLKVTVYIGPNQMMLSIFIQ